MYGILNRDELKHHATILHHYNVVGKGRITIYGVSQLKYNDNHYVRHLPDHESLDMTNQKQKPTGDLTIRTVAMPSDTNPRGDIFGGWLMSQMDLAGGIMATRRAKGRTATIAVNNMVFHQPVHIGNVVTCYADVIRIGTTSMSIKIEAWAQHYAELGGPNKVTEGVFTYVAIDQERKPRPVPEE